MDQGQIELVLAFFKKPQDEDFGPSLAHEYLVEEAGLNISLSSVRSIMIKHGIWKLNSAKKGENPPA
jgi:hypothetical protein